MIIYNVTVKLDWAIHEAWLAWVQEEHMSEVAATGCFTRYQLVRLLEVDEKDGPTYAAQYFANNKSDYNRYIEIFAAAIRQKAIDKWGEGFVVFRSLMQIVQ